MALPERPLSPHLQIYRPQLTSLLSIVHRATGVALALGAFGIVWWLVVVAAGAQPYADFIDVADSALGRVALFGFSFCLMFHFLNGIRHMLWDIGWGFDLPRTYASGWTVVVLSVLLTAGLWLSILTSGSAA